MTAPASTAPGPTVDEAGTDTDVVLDAAGLSVDFELDGEQHPVVDRVDLHLRPSERLALVGESGSGKTVTSLAMLRLLPSMGTVRAERMQVAGHSLLDLDDAALDRVRGHDVAMIFQDPMSSLNPVVRVDRQLAGPMERHLDLNRAEIRERSIELLTKVGIPEPARCLRTYPHELSGGMRQRVMIAMALSCRPKLLLADEPTTALDVTIQAQIIRLLTQLSDDLGLATLLVTHDLGVVARFAHRVAVMYAGRVVEHGTVADVFARPQHPYTQALLASIPSTDREQRLLDIPGAPPPLRNRGAGCSFAPRCTFAEERCATAPELTARAAGHLAACHVTADRPVTLSERHDTLKEVSGAR